MATAKQLAWRKKFAKMAKSGAFKKKRIKKKTVKRNPTRKVVKRKTVKRKTARRSPVRAMKKSTATRRAAAGRKKTATGTQVRRNPANYVIKAIRPTKSGYTYYWLRGEQFVKNVAHATRHTTKGFCHKKMHKILPHLPASISSIRCEKV